MNKDNIKHRKHTTKRVIVFFLILCVFGAVLPGASVVKAAGGTVEGYITDEDAGGVPIQNIYVMVDNQDGTFPSDVTNASGFYQITGVKAGSRNVVAARGTTAGGTATDMQYAMAHAYNVMVTDGGTARQDRRSRPPGAGL